MKDFKASRRGFFQAAAIGGAAAAAVVVTTVVGERKSATPAATPDASKQLGYRETEHIRRYYRSTQV